MKLDGSLLVAEIFQCGPKWRADTASSYAVSVAKNGLKRRVIRREKGQKVRKGGLQKETRHVRLNIDYFFNRSHF